MPLYTGRSAKKQKTSMKKSIRIFFIQLIFLFSSRAIFAQTKDLLPRYPDYYSDIFFYATRLYTQGAIEEAEVELKRYLFMQNYAKGKYEAGALCMLAGIYEQKEEYDLAAESIQKAIVLYEQDGKSQVSLEALRSTHINYLLKASAGSKEYLSNNLFIFSYMNLPDFSDKIRIQAYSAAITDAVENGRIEYAQKTYNQAVELFPQAWTDEQQETIFNSFEKLDKFKPKNQKLAGILSFVPGLGQLYAGNYADSLNAFLLNGSLIAVSVWSICTLDFWTFSLLEFNPLMRFMQGNIYNAQKDAYQYNLKKQQELTQPICENLQNAL